MTSGVGPGSAPRHVPGSAPGSRRVAVAATLVTVLLMVAIQVVAVDLVTAAAPLGLVSLQFVADSGEAARIVGSWTGPVRTAALRAHALDLVLPIAYAVAISAAARALGTGRAAGTSAARLARRAGGAAVAAACLDQVENAAIAATLLAGPGPRSVAVTVVSAAAKWLLLAGALVGLALAWWRVQPIRSR